MAVWAFLHLLLFGLGLTHYGLKDNLTTARATFGITYSEHQVFSSRRLCLANAVIARGSALVCHLDVAFILFPVCRNFISVLRRTPLNNVIP